jgi:hypothetical protein
MSEFVIETCEKGQLNNKLQIIALVRHPSVDVDIHAVRRPPSGEKPG